MSKATEAEEAVRAAETMGEVMARTGEHHTAAWQSVCGLAA